MYVGMILLPKGEEKKNQILSPKNQKSSTIYINLRLLVHMYEVVKIIHVAPKYNAESYVMY